MNELSGARQPQLIISSFIFQLLPRDQLVVLSVSPFIKQIEKNSNMMKFFIKAKIVLVFKLNNVRYIMWEFIQ